MAGTPDGRGRLSALGHLVQDESPWSVAGSGEDRIHRGTRMTARIDDVDTGRGPRCGARRDEPRAAYLGDHGAGQVPDVASGNGPGVGGRLHRPLDLAHQPPPAIDRAGNDVRLRREAGLPGRPAISLTRCAPLPNNVRIRYPRRRRIRRRSGLHQRGSRLQRLFTDVTHELPSVLCACTAWHRVDAARHHLPEEGR